MWYWFWPFFRWGQFDTLVRHAVMADARRMAEIHSDSFAIGWATFEFEAMLAGGEIADVMVSRGIWGEIVTGFALSRVVVDEAELLSIALDEEVRGHNLASGLLASHAQHVRRAGATSLFLEVAADNLPALALYRGNGFVEIGRRKGYYPALSVDKPDRRDALTMRLDLSHLDPTPRAW